MARWYQNVLTGVQVEVKTLDEDDFYVENASNWARIKAPSSLKVAEMTLRELHDFAETHGIDLGKATKKADIVAAIEKA